MRQLAPWFHSITKGPAKGLCGSKNCVEAETVWGRVSDPSRPSEGRLALDQTTPRSLSNNLLRLTSILRSSHAPRHHPAPTHQDWTSRRHPQSRQQETRHPADAPDGQERPSPHKVRAAAPGQSSRQSLQSDGSRPRSGNSHSGSTRFIPTPPAPCTTRAPGSCWSRPSFPPSRPTLA